MIATSLFISLGNQVESEKTAAIENIKLFGADLRDVSRLLAREKEPVKWLCLSRLLSYN